MALVVHRLTLSFPDYEKYELGSQLRKATKSIALNIAEGYGKRKSANEFKRFLAMAIGSCDETKVLISFAGDLGYLSQAQCVELKSEYDTIGKMLYRLHSNWKQR